MKRGTILENDYVKPENPNRRVVYTHTSTTGGGPCGTRQQLLNFIYACDGKIKRGAYYKDTVGDGKPIHPVGESNILTMLAEILEAKLKGADNNDR